VPIKVKLLQIFPNETKNALKERFGINELKLQTFQTSTKLDLKSLGNYCRAGSIPAPGTSKISLLKIPSKKKKAYSNTKNNPIVTRRQ